MGEIIEYVKNNIETNLKIKEELIELKKQNVSTQAKRAEELTANLVVYSKAIEMMGDEIFDLGIENETLREKLGDVDEKWLTEEIQRIKISHNEGTKKKFILERMQKQYSKLKQK